MKKILIFLPFLVLIHGIEEYYFGLQYQASEAILTGASLLPLFSHLNTNQAIYIVYIIMQVLLFVAVALFMSGNKKAKKILLMVIGLLFIYQAHHIIETLISFQYNPGLVTSILFVILGYYYWKNILGKNQTGS